MAKRNIPVGLFYASYNSDCTYKLNSSFLSVDAKRSYCIYEGPTASAIVDAAKTIGLPADTITEIDGRINNDGKVVLLAMSDFERVWIQLLSAPFGLCDTTKVNWYISFVYPHAPRRGAYEGVYSVDPPPKI